MMVFFQTFSNFCITENLSFNGVFLRSKAAARVILVDRILLAMSAADNFEENTKSDLFYVPSYSIGCFHQIFRKCFNFICSYINYTFCLISVNAILRPLHCVKSVQIRSFFWSVFSSIQTEYGDIRSISPYSVRNAGKCGTEKIPYLDIFHTVLSITFLRNEAYLKPHGD